MYCPNCDSEVESVVRIISETYPVKGEEVTIDASVMFCKCCGNDIWDDELDARNLRVAFDVYRYKHKLLMPAEIREIRERYGLSQVAFAKVLGLGDKTITRYENGSIADTAQNNLIELVRQPTNFKMLLEKNKSRITEQDYKAACDALDRLRPSVVYTTKKSTTYNAHGGIKYKNVRQFWGDLNYA
ncbi:MAG: type II toxin-antitoxin system MqsA family antitoxin [Ruminiclostridium sp.]|nr:type II toxin-antitoxin system MqsA family antitoxin [Ruminiclostridium sp.]